MKIALFLEAYHPYTNGVITYASSLKDSFEKLGHEVLVVTANPDVKHHEIKDGVLYCPAKKLKKIYGYGLAAPFSRTRLRLLKEFDPDIFHIHNEFGICLFGARAAKKLKTPLVYTLHTMYDDYFFYVAKGPLVPVVRGACYKYIKYLTKNAATLTSPSAKAVDFLKKCKVEKNVFIIPNSIDVEAFESSRFEQTALIKLREQLGIEKDDLVGMFIGRLGKEKSVDVLIDDFSSKFKSEDHFKLLVVGGGPELEPLREQAKALGMEKRIIFTDKINHEDTPKYFAACDYYVSASLSEMMSISTMEAMAAGLPAIVKFDEKNISQVIEGVNGWIFRTAEEMEQYIRGLDAMSPDERHEFSRKVSETMSDKTSLESAKFIISTYQQAIDSSVG